MKALLILLPLMFSEIMFGQAQEIPLYPQNYFRNPLNIPIVLAGNFGEPRSNHFHSGIDIKTNGKENLPVFAAAEGYISRIKMEKGGFGHALYVTHPEGFTTLYAHLNNFAPPIQKYLKRTQYEKESWAVDIQVSANMFPVRRGEQIAWSGNTGGSAGPHLHFEIRDTETEHPLNPQLFGFDISDTRAPVPTHIGVYDLGQSFFSSPPKIVGLKNTGKVFTTDTIVVNTTEVGIGINVNDYMNGSTNTLNFYTARWFVDGEHYGMIRLDDIGYDVTRYLHAYIDYPTKKQSNQWYQLLFRLPGNQLHHLYPVLNGRGAISLSDKPRHLKIELTDAAGNQSDISFYIRSSGTVAEAQCSNLFKYSSSNTFEHPNLKFLLSDQHLYDDICFDLKTQQDEKNYSDRFIVHNISVPVHKYFDLSIKPNKAVPFELRDKVVMMYSDGKSEDAKAATFENGWYTTGVRTFGTYWLSSDTTPPVIKPLQAQGADLSKAKRLSFAVRDNLTSVKSFRAELDGKWLCFEPRGDTFFYTFDEHCPKGKHKLVITAGDENNNIQTLVYTFTK